MTSPTPLLRWLTRTVGRVQVAHAFLFLLLSPLLLALWCLPWVVTQDGPAHVLNARILNALLTGHSVLGSIYTVNWSPLPNLTGHLSLMVLLRIFSARVSDRLLMTLTLAGVACSVVWLRRRVAGDDSLAVSALIGVTIAVNTAWLLGFYSFLLGTCGFAMTLGVWWSRRDKPGRRMSAIVAALLLFTYFSHLVAAVATAAGLLVLSVTTPGPVGRRLRWSVVAITPMVLLAIFYARLALASGGADPEWATLTIDWMPWWRTLLQSADPFALSPDHLPLIRASSPWFEWLAPSVWIAVGVLTFAAGAFVARKSHHLFLHERRGWVVLSGALISGWLLAPDNLGANHGSFIRERFLLLGLIALVPVLSLTPVRRSVRLGIVAMGVACALQTAFVWDYALVANRSVAPFMSADAVIPRGSRVVTLVIEHDQRFAAHPLLHLGGYLGVSRDLLIWNNYEANYYYFPVKVRDARTARLSQQLASLGILYPVSPDQFERKLLALGELLAEHHEQIDVLLIWGMDARVDDISSRWFQSTPFFTNGSLRLFARR